MDPKTPHSEDDLTISRPELLSGGSDQQFREMLHNLLAFAARLEKLRASFGAHMGLSGLQYTILISIRQLQCGGDIGVKAVADHLALSAAFVTSETNKLMQQGLITKTQDPDDGRRVNLQVTSAATRLLRQLAPVQREINDELFKPVSRDAFGPMRELARDLRESSERAVLLSDYLVQRERADR